MNVFKIKALRMILEKEAVLQILIIIQLELTPVENYVPQILARKSPFVVGLNSFD